MVFFTCNACGASLKKNQVEKHYQSQCRNCNVLSCMDCGKDFFGDEYAAHTKCISEAEKYQGALFKESGGGGASKGEKKQLEWLDRVKQSSSTVKVSTRIASLLERIAEYPNVPRKKKKFENFVRNSINVHDDKTLSQLWDVFNEASKPPPPVNPDPTVPSTDTVTETANSEPTKKKKSKKQSVESVEMPPQQITQDNAVSEDSPDIGNSVDSVLVSKKKKKKDKVTAKPKRKHASDNDSDVRTKKRKVEN